MLNQDIKYFIDIKRLAVVGVSRHQKKFGNKIFSELKRRGYQVYPVNPALQEIHGEPCYPDLTALQDLVDGAVICISLSGVPSVLQEAAAIGMKNIWVQTCAESPESTKLGRDLGLNLVVGKCIMLYAEPVPIYHRFRRFFARIFRKL